ncbi:hypothetical protein HKO22_03695 [Peptoniphilus sp. AGMB00490]|uniref:Uncharacterized protein n=1 Tax=Peptoniphilus faecalis TaxID=2731255 RepID=A0A848RAJ6_9FIRM|nr:hypothetical protein [Peptoniphilus faecalis]NMW84848.1 hypothetical protein [Peptoniphilus faecalis]
MCKISMLIILAFLIVPINSYAIEFNAANSKENIDTNDLNRYTVVVSQWYNCPNW